MQTHVFMLNSFYCSASHPPSLENQLCVHMETLQRLEEGQSNRPDLLLESMLTFAKHGLPLKINSPFYLESLTGSVSLV